MFFIFFIFYLCSYFFPNSNLSIGYYLFFHLRRLNFFFFLNHLVNLLILFFSLNFLHFCFLFSHFLLLVRKFFFDQHISIFQIILRDNSFCFFNRNFIGFVCLKLSSYCSHCVVFRILNEMVHNYTLIIISPMFNFIFCYLSQPKIVFLSKGIKYVNSCVRCAHLHNNCTISSISHINCSKLSWIATDEGFCSFK